MTYGMQTSNGANVLNIDENLKAFVYLGKWAIPDRDGEHVSVTITCVGFPMVFFNLPYAISAGEPPASDNMGWQACMRRNGVAMTALVPLGGNQWRLDFSVSNPADVPFGLFVRVFGRLDLNFPNGSGESYGAQIWNASSQLVFDSNLRMLRLAGNTYDTELVLTPSNPAADQANSTYDLLVNLPFSMLNKSISASARGIIYQPYNDGGYNDWDTGVWWDNYKILTYESLYWASGNQLQVRRIGLNVSYYKSPVPLVIDNSRCQTVYSRLAVIDNSLFP